MNIKVLFTVCVAMTTQSVLGGWLDRTISACTGTCKPQSQLECRSPYSTPFSIECGSIVCCPPGQGTDTCKCFEKRCPSSWEEDGTQNCAKCCRNCDCVPKAQNCNDDRVESRGTLCSDRDEFYKECCSEFDGTCYCMNVLFNGLFNEQEGKSCQPGYVDNGMCKSCCVP